MNNITLTKPETNLVNKLTAEYGLVISDRSTEVVNPWNAHRVTTTPLAAALIRFAQIAYNNYAICGKMSYNRKPVAISIYDRARYLVLKLDKNAYAQVLD